MANKKSKDELRYNFFIKKTLIVYSARVIITVSFLLLIYGTFYLMVKSGDKEIVKYISKTIISLFESDKKFTISFVFNLLLFILLIINKINYNKLKIYRNK